MFGVFRVFDLHVRRAFTAACIPQRSSQSLGSTWQNATSPCAGHRCSTRSQSTMLSTAKSRSCPLNCLHLHAFRAGSQTKQRRTACRNQGQRSEGGGYLCMPNLLHIAHIPAAICSPSVKDVLTDGRVSRGGASCHRRGRARCTKSKKQSRRARQCTGMASRGQVSHGSAVLTHGPEHRTHLISASNSSPWVRTSANA